MRQNLIYNKFLPWGRYKCINLFGVLFIRKGCTMSAEDYNHEDIHTEQMKELLYIGFYLWYLVEWIIRLFGKGNAYKNLCFEKEAYDNDEDLAYLDKRKPYAWLDYL